MFYFPNKLEKKRKFTFTIPSKMFQQKRMKKLHTHLHLQLSTNPKYILAAMLSSLNRRLRRSSEKLLNYSKAFALNLLNTRISLSLSRKKHANQQKNQLIFQFSTKIGALYNLVFNLKKKPLKISVFIVFPWYCNIAIIFF